MSTDYTRWYCCQKCKDVWDYRHYPSGENTFPRGEFLAHYDYLTTGFKSKEDAEKWLLEHPIEESSSED